MKLKARNIIALLTGFFLGNLINMFLIQISGNIISPPEGADLTSMEGLIESMSLFEPRHFIMPFVAHAMGTFSGALTASLIVKEKKFMFSLVIGFVFLILGAVNVYMLPAPVWFNIVDLVFAYIPMSLIAAKLVSLKK